MPWVKAGTVSRRPERPREPGLDRAERMITGPPPRRYAIWPTLTESDNVPSECLSPDAYTSNSLPVDLQTLSLQRLPEIDSLPSAGRTRSPPPECIPFASRVLTRSGNRRRILNMPEISRLSRRRQLFLGRLSLSICSLD